MDVLKKIISLAVVSLSVVGLVSCDNCIYDDLSECPQGVIFGFHSQTPCQGMPTYPSEIKEIKIFAFDESGVLLRVLDTKEVQLAKEYQLKTDYLYVGTSSFVAWGGEDLSQYDFSFFEEGKTTKSDMMVSLRRQSDQVSADMAHIFVGVPTEGDLTQEDRRELGTHYDTVVFNMKRLTNNVHLTVLGLRPNRDYTMKLTAANSRYDILGNTLQDERFTYIPSMMERVEDALKADYRLLKLERNKDIRLTIINKYTGQVVYSADLVDDLIAYDGISGTSPINLDCVHEYNLTIKVKPSDDLEDTYVAVEATINQWNIVFREVILKN